MAKPHHLLWVFSTFSTGGPQIRFCQLVAEFGDKYCHTIIAMDGNYDALPRAKSCGDVCTLPTIVHKSSGISLKNLKNFKSIINSIKPDLLITNNWGAIEWFFANIFDSIPHIHIEDGFGPNERPDNQLKRRIMLRRLAFLRNGPAYIAPSKVLEHVFHDTWKVRAKDIHYIPNGVDCAQFTNNNQTMNDAPITIGSLGALRPEKRFDRLIDAFALLATKTDSQLHIIGDGPEMSKLQSHAETTGYADRIHFLGATDQPYKALQKLHIYALSSDTEQMPISMVEAMATGLPIVATDVGDVKHMLPIDNKPYVVSSTEKLADALYELILNPELRRSLGETNKTKAIIEFQQSTMAEKYHKLFQQMITSAVGKA